MFHVQTNFVNYDSSLKTITINSCLQFKRINPRFPSCHDITDVIEIAKGLPEQPILNDLDEINS